MGFPDADTFNTRLARVDGRVERGSRVMMGDVFVPVRADGTFTTTVEMSEGVNRLKVTVTDTLGRSLTEESHAIRVDTQAPTLTGVTIGQRALEDDDSVSGQ